MLADFGTLPEPAFALESLANMDISEIRTDNLETILEVFFDGKSGPLVKKLGVDPSQISRVRKDSKSNRTMGSTLARKIESALGFPRGFIDQPRSKQDFETLAAPIPKEHLPSEALKIAIEEAEHYISEQKLIMSPEQKSALILLLVKAMMEK